MSTQSNEQQAIFQEVDFLSKLSLDELQKVLAAKSLYELLFLSLQQSTLLVEAALNNEMKKCLPSEWYQLYGNLGIVAAKSVQNSPNPAMDLETRLQTRVKDEWEGRIAFATAQLQRFSRKELRELSEEKKNRCAEETSLTIEAITQLVNGIRVAKYQLENPFTLEKSYQTQGGFCHRVSTKWVACQVVLGSFNYDQPNFEKIRQKQEQYMQTMSEVTEEAYQEAYRRTGSYDKANVIVSELGGNITVTLNSLPVRTWLAKFTEAKPKAINLKVVRGTTHINALESSESIFQKPTEYFANKRVEYGEGYLVSFHFSLNNKQTGGHSMGVAEINCKPWIFDPNQGALSHSGNSNDFAGDFEDFVFAHYGPSTQQVDSFEYEIRPIRARVHEKNVYRPAGDAVEENVLADLFDTAQLLVAMKKEFSALNRLMNEKVLSAPYGLPNPSLFMLQVVASPARRLLESLKQRTDQLAASITEIERSPPRKGQLDRIRNKCGYSQLISFENEVAHQKEAAQIFSLRRQEELYQIVETQWYGNAHLQNELIRLPKDPRRDELVEKIVQRIAIIEKCMRQLKTTMFAEDLNQAEQHADEWNRDNYAHDVAALIETHNRQTTAENPESSNDTQILSDQTDSHIQPIEHMEWEAIPFQQKEVYVARQIASAIGDLLNNANEWPCLGKAAKKVMNTVTAIDINAPDAMRRISEVLDDFKRTKETIRDFIEEVQDRLWESNDHPECMAAINHSFVAQLDHLVSTHWDNPAEFNKRYEVALAQFHVDRDVLLLGNPDEHISLAKSMQERALLWLGHFSDNQNLQSVKKFATQAIDAINALDVTSNNSGIRGKAALEIQTIIKNFGVKHEEINEFLEERVRADLWESNSQIDLTKVNPQFMTHIDTLIDQHWDNQEHFNPLYKKAVEALYVERRIALLFKDLNNKMDEVRQKAINLSKQPFHQTTSPLYSLMAIKLPELLHQMIPHVTSVAIADSLKLHLVEIEKSIDALSRTSDQEVQKRREIIGSITTEMGKMERVIGLQPQHKNPALNSLVTSHHKSTGRM